MVKSKDYTQTGRLFLPVPGKTYENLNGSFYKCLYADGVTGAVMQSCSSPNGAEAWTFLAKGCRQYIDGLIDWEYSSEGHWEVKA